MYSKERPKVSVYISTCNRLDKLKRAITSVLQQDYSNLEIIICDDASSDGTTEFIQNLILKYKNIIYIRNEKNEGACVTRNKGIFRATGKYITGLDDDDEFSKDRISFFLDNWDDKYSFICCNFTNKYENGEEKKYYKCSKNRVFTYEDILFENEASNQIFTLTERLISINGFDNRVRRLQDWDTWLRLSYKYGSFIRLSKSTYIMHHDHLSNEVRVSESTKITESLIGLIQRNSNIYKKNEERFMRYIVSSMEKKALFKESLYWTFKNRNVKYLIKYIFQ